MRWIPVSPSTELLTPTAPRALPLRCRICGSESDPTPAAICEHCLGPLDVVYDKHRTLPDRATIAVPLNDPSITWATYRIGQYTTPWTSQADARTRVRHERRVELAMEGQRFFDLRRWGIAEATLNTYLTAEKVRRLYLAAAEPFASRHRWYPIPAIQIELSKVNGQPMLTQNAGW